MSFQEKFTWVSAVVSALVAAAYFTFVAGQLQSTPAASVAYQIPLMVSVGTLIALTIVGTIAMAIGTAITSQIEARITGGEPDEDVDRKDERDESIDKRGELVGYYVTSAGALGALALAMMRYDQFWIANALYLSFVAGTLAAAIAKIVAYRRGF